MTSKKHVELPSKISDIQKIWRIILFKKKSHYVKDIFQYKHLFDSIE